MYRTAEELAEEYEGFERSGRVIPARVRNRHDVGRGERQAVLRRIVGAIAIDLADSFGFQKGQVHVSAGSAGGEARPVMSSVANQVDHLVALLSNRMDAVDGSKDFVGALYDAIAALHAKVLTNYEKWVRRLKLLPRVDERLTGMLVSGVPCLSLGAFDATFVDFASLDEGYAWVHNAQLQRLTLFFLIHGEAANLRHLPECLCFIFYTMVHSLVLVDTRDSYKATGVDFPAAMMRSAEQRPGGADAAKADDFLMSVVTPIYELIRHEVG